MIEETLDRTVRELRNEADIDFIDLPFIAGSLREDLDLKTQEEIRRHTLDVIRRLMERGVYPGDYDHAIHMAFWPGEPSGHLRRIEAEWIAMGKPLTLSDPICWPQARIQSAKIA
jgi:hypothetical protein